ncbi:single-stranded DNA-binding protein [Kurthia senegalensis]|uniref:single-stranded DNA-binding protein n=1 Tax=Kurthia senegalensis TaxID=1033740 RepID=UPI00028A1B89|nr:single-stranded DNA-binding protein [Kurthia senegalensis]
MKGNNVDGTPSAVKAACSVWDGGKLGEQSKSYLSSLAWGKTAQNVVTYCGKGSLIGVSGRVQTRSFVNQQNEKVYRTDFIAEEVRFLALKEPNAQMTSSMLADFELPEGMEIL